VIVYAVDGVVTDLNAELGYCGTTPSGLSVGSSWSELKEIYENLFFEEELYWVRIF